MENMERQSVKIGVDRFFFAPLIKDDDTGVEYESSVYLPGVNVVVLYPNSDIRAFYADDGVYETYVLEGEREMQVSFAGLSNEVTAKLTGASYKNGLLKDKRGDNPPYVAVGFRTQKSNGEYKYIWVYKGRFVKSKFTSNTKSSAISPQPDVYTFKAVSRVNDNAWRQQLDSDDLSVTLTNEELNNENTGWFSTPDFTLSVD